MKRYFAVKQGDTTYVTDGNTMWGSGKKAGPVLYATIVDIGGCGSPGYDEGSFYILFYQEDLGEHISLDAAASYWFG